MAAHVLWEHEVVGSNPTAPTTSFTIGRPGVVRRRARESVRAEGRGTAIVDRQDLERPGLLTGHARGACGHPRQGDPVDGGTPGEQILDRLDGDVTLHRVAVNHGRVAARRL